MKQLSTVLLSGCALQLEAELLKPNTATTIDVFLAIPLIYHDCVWRLFHIGNGLCSYFTFSSTHEHTHYIGRSCVGKCKPYIYLNLFIPLVWYHYIYIVVQKCVQEGGM